MRVSSWEEGTYMTGCAVVERRCLLSIMHILYSLVDFLIGVSALFMIITTVVQRMYIYVSWGDGWGSGAAIRPSTSRRVGSGTAPAPPAHIAGTSTSRSNKHTQREREYYSKKQTQISLLSYTERNRRI